MDKVTREDELTAQAIIAVEFNNSHANFAAEIAELIAAHRRQAEEAMRERCAEVAEDFPLAEDHPDAGMLGCRDLDIAAAIRSMEVE